MKQLNTENLLTAADYIAKVNMLDETGKAFLFISAERETALENAKTVNASDNKERKESALKTISNISDFIAIPGYTGKVIKSYEDKTTNLVMYKLDNKFFRCGISAWYKVRKASDKKEPFNWNAFDVAYCKFVHVAIKRIKADVTRTANNAYAGYDSNGKRKTGKDGKPVASPYSNATLQGLFQSVVNAIGLERKINRADVRMFLNGLSKYNVGKRALDIQTLTTIEKLFIDVLNGMDINDKTSDTIVKRDNKRREQEHKASEKSLKKVENKVGERNDYYDR